MGYFFTTRSGSILNVEDTGVSDSGSNSGSPVLALHGIGGGAYFFAGVAKRLSAGEIGGNPSVSRRVISIDLPGTGRSTSVPTDFTLESWIADIGDLVRDKIGEPVILLGHSLGTILALKAWETWPEQIRGFVFTCGLPKARPNINERLSARAEAITQDIAANRGLTNWGPKVSPGVFSKKSLAEQPEMVGLFERLFEEQRGPEYVRCIENLLAADMNAVVSTVTVPCIAIAGQDDSYAPPASVEEFVAKLGVTCPVEVLDGCAHMAFLENPEAYAATVERFLKTLP